MVLVSKTVYIQERLRRDVVKDKRMCPVLLGCADTCNKEFKCVIKDSVWVRLHLREKENYIEAH